uniref:Metalloendopeptidase n=1 Tax=Romanomermis culicivorax TaxID=13658 RepID=A0A915JQL1_ROMCU
MKYKQILDHRLYQYKWVEYKKTLISENDVLIADDSPNRPLLADNAGQRIFLDVVDILEKQTCLRFKSYDKFTDTNYLFVSDLGGCWSFVGRQIDRFDGQELSLSRSCWDSATVSHEIMHVLGYYHEHSRFDRDEYITINLKNVDRKHWTQFDKRAPDETDLLTEYDYKSILHYNAFAWALDKSIPTIKAKKTRNGTNLEIGQSGNFSKLDFEKINKLYKCNWKKSDGKNDVHFFRMQQEADKMVVFKSINQDSIGGDCPRSQQFCEDSNLACTIWAAQGWCELMPGKMLVECRKSCCNCLETRCMDTSQEFYSRNFCHSSSYYENGMFRLIRYPLTCYAERTSRYAADFCPKMCGRCRASTLF